MEIEYRPYQSGYEKQQAKIYSESSGILATAEEILQRYKTEKTDPQYIRFAFTKEGKALAYCQVRLEKKGSIAIGYPWALPNCPTEVQEKLFNDLMTYMSPRCPTDYH